MKAVVLVGKEDLQILDIPEPKMVEEDHIIVKVGACGVCGSDVRYFYGENPWSMHTLGYHVENVPNITLGHEFAGTVVQVNSDRYSHLLGKRVIVQPWKGCGVCEFCITGRENLCQVTQHHGHGQGWPEMDYYPGAMAEYCLAWGDYVYEIPDSVSFDLAAMSDILGVAIHAINQSRALSGGNIICLGGGPAGIYIALLELARGANKAFLIENSPLAREIISEFDNCIGIDPDAKNSMEELTRLMGDNKCSAIYDSVGSASLMARYIPFLSESGCYVNLATQDTDLVLPSSVMSAERIFTTSSNALYDEIRESVDIITSRTLPLERIITHHCTFDTFLETFELLLKEPKEAFKVVLQIE